MIAIPIHTLERSWTFGGHNNRSAHHQFFNALTFKKSLRISIQSKHINDTQRTHVRRSPALANLDEFPWLSAVPAT
jgi:hypothetical protein